MAPAARPRPHGPLEIDNLHVEIEATRIAYAARNQLLGDTAREGAKTVAYLLSDKRVDRSSRLDTKASPHHASP